MNTKIFSFGCRSMSLVVFIAPMISILFFTTSLHSQNVGIGTTTPDASAMLEIEATNKGLLIPRVALTSVTDGTTIPSPATSLLVYNTGSGGLTPAGYYYNSGTTASPSWVRLSTTPVGSEWKLTGNSGTIDGTHFIGTTNNVSLNFRVNNQKAGRIGNTGDNSVFLGMGAGRNDDGTDNKNTFIGAQSGNFNTTGDNNTACGYRALFSNTEGHGNTAGGYQALYLNNTGYRNTAVGNESLRYNTTGNYNTANGNRALYLNTTASQNSASGNWALYSNTSGDYNSGFGAFSLQYNATGNNNVALGANAGSGASGVNFNQCTFVGSNSFPVVSRTNVTMLGYGIVNAQCTSDNQVLLGNTSVTQIRAQVGSITTYSDQRFKFNISEDVKGLDFITRLRPVSYNENPEILHQIWGTPDSLISSIDHSRIKNIRFTGLIAQEVEQAMLASGYREFTGIDIPQNDQEVYSLRYGDFIMPLVKAVQELNDKNLILERENAEIKSENAKIKIENAELKATIISENAALKAEIESLRQRFESIMSAMEKAVLSSHE